MRLWTWLEIKTKVENDLDLQGEEITTPEEMLGYVNEAIDEAEAVIHNIAEDYFFTRTEIALVNGTKLYNMPADIYAGKIRSLQFDDGTVKYPIYRVKNLNIISSILPTDQYQWLPTNKLNDGVITDYGPKIELYPTSYHDGSYVTCYYLRNARRMVLNTDECDIPEFVAFIINFVKAKVAVKELHPRLDYMMSELERTREQMAITLTEMTPDGDLGIEGDYSSYDDQGIF